MGIEATLAGAMAALPETRLPDGRVYELRPISLGDLLRVRRLLQSDSDDATSLHVYLRIAATLTGASREVIALLQSDAVGQIVSLAQEAVHTLASAMQETAPPSPTPAPETDTPLDLAEVGVNVARVYGLPFTTVLEWSAADVLIAAWSIVRAVSGAHARPLRRESHSGRVPRAAKALGVGKVTRGACAGAGAAGEANERRLLDGL